MNLKIRLTRYFSAKKVKNRVMILCETKLVCVTTLACRRRLTSPLLILSHAGGFDKEIISEVARTTHQRQQQTAGVLVRSQCFTGCKCQCWTHKSIYAYDGSRNPPIIFCYCLGFGIRVACILKLKLTHIYALNQEANIMLDGYWLILRNLPVN